MKPIVGINSLLIKEISNGPIYAKEVDLIEINFDESKILNEGTVNYDRLEELKALGNKFSIHGPYTNYCSNIKFGLGIECKWNIEGMRKVLAAADYLNADSIVLHGDVVTGDYRDSMLNVIVNLKELSKLAKQYSITLLLENMIREAKNDRVGVLPEEILQILKIIDEENVKFCFDMGHGNLSASLYKFSILDFIDYLAPYLYEVHIHDNAGIPAIVNSQHGDEHLPLGEGKINYAKILQETAKTDVKNLVLELNPQSKRADVLESVSTLKSLIAKS
ncbi:MAG: sugar phosphate isomerase/epimerase family protein [Candidatus Bathyarchaeia archaeon]|jgi:sugar phosphate isomerase/epimerase